MSDKAKALADVLYAHHVIKYDPDAALRCVERALTSAREEALREAAEKLHRYYEALVQADLKIRSYPGADQSDVEFIRVAIGEMPSLITGVGERG